MKTIKTIIILLILIFNSFNLFAKSGLEIGIFVPIGMSISLHAFDSSEYGNNNSGFNQYKENNAKKTKAGFEIGILSQLGYKFQINKDFSVSLLGELGYFRDSINYSLKDTETNSYIFVMKNSIYNTFDSLLIGAIPKLNYKNFSFSLGFGVKVPLYAEINYSSKNKSIGYITENITMIKANKMKTYFKYQAIPFIKFVFDYSFYSSVKFDMVLSAYFNYDFPIYHQNKNLNNSVNPIEKLSSIDLGFQLGAKIRPI